MSFDAALELSSLPEPGSAKPKNINRALSKRNGRTFQGTTRVGSLIGVLSPVAKAMVQQVIEKVSPSTRLQMRDCEAWIAETPEDATVKGMYLDSLRECMKAQGATLPVRKQYFSFKDYPLREFMALKLEAVRILYPNHPPREGLRLLGQLAFPTLMTSTVGRVIFAVAGRNWQAALQLSKQAYNVSVSGNLNLRDLSETSVVIEMREVWNFADCYQVGVFEGAMRSFHISGRVRAQKLKRRCDVDLYLSWT
jgi:uncharacterized protein (TIGR02265 family)